MIEHLIDEVVQYRRIIDELQSIKSLTLESNGKKYQLFGPIGIGLFIHALRYISFNQMESK